MTVIDARPAGLAQVFVNARGDADYGHACQLSQKHDVRVCTDPNHDRDANLLRDALIVCGVLPDPHKSGRRGFDGKFIPLRGRCRGCKKMQDLQTDGKVRSHKHRGEYCAGRYQEPMAEPEQVAS